MRKNIKAIKNVRLMPESKEKNNVRKYLFDICSIIQPNRVFSLIGSNAGLVSMLSTNIEIVSAEKQKELKNQQLVTYPQYTHYDNILDAMTNEKPFDFIWLDFFANCTIIPHMLEIGASLANLNSSGILAITSLNRRHRGCLKGNFENVFKQRIRGVSLLNKIEYRNNVHPMSLFVLKKV